MTHNFLFTSSQIKLFQSLLSNTSSLTQQQQKDVESFSKHFSNIIEQNKNVSEKKMILIQMTF
jgi:hypothetical protein